MRCKACNRPIIHNLDGIHSLPNILTDSDTGEEIIIEEQEVEYCYHCLAIADHGMHSNTYQYEHQCLSEGITKQSCSTYEYHSGSDYYFSWYENT